MAATFNPAVQGMGIGTVGIGNPDVIFKRKFRWTLSIESNGGCYFNVPPHFVKVAGRPSISFEETEVNFLNDKMWIPGKASWEPITVTYLDNNQNSSVELLKWLTSVFDFTSPTSKKMSSKRSSYSGLARLTLYDGCGGVMEEWELQDAWPQAINFGDLDYSSSDIAEIELTLRYSMVKYTSRCGTTFEPCDCIGC